MGILYNGIATTGSIASTYTRRVLSVRPDGLIHYYPLIEQAGTNADNAEGTTALDGTFARDIATMGVDIGISGYTAPLFDASNDYCDVYSVELKDGFSKDVGTMMCWAKVSGAGVWTDASWRYIMYLAAAATNYVFLGKSSTSNQLTLRYRANSINKQQLHTISATDWIHLVITWNTGADEFKAFVNGAQIGSTLGTLPVWSGDLANTTCILGSATLTPTLVFDGYLAHAATWNVVLTPAQILYLSIR